ncbi:MAG TPA: NAD-dependent epimerase/dehydratase family protein [Bryobacteraceae bacterium]|jgi:UDP-glucose 4-epimerase|nr:NAD-dependent epimerase/dehydratase family protein [Bryobacteraceae bacterium]
MPPYSNQVVSESRSTAGENGASPISQRWFIVGGAGFIGSHFTDALLAIPTVAAVTIFDNFSSGREWHYQRHCDNPALKVVRGDVNDSDLLTTAMAGHDVVIHLASNPDIARAVKDPDIDFRAGTVLTRQVLEAMRVTGVRHILYASGSGVYGDAGALEFSEDHGPLLPISTYGASKLAGEALIASYCYMFGLKGCAFRFGNVVGPRQTHGVGFDFVRQLLDHPGELRILGDGSQSKSYIHVEDVVRAVLLAHRRTRQPFAVYNVATGDYITVTEIAEIAAQTVGSNGKTKFAYTGGDRGWKGDVPVVRLNTARIRSLGWECRRNTADAIRASLTALLPQAVKERTGRLVPVVRDRSQEELACTRYTDSK